MKIDFEYDTPHGVFRDALHLPDGHGYSDSEIEAMKEQRRDNWIAVVTAPPVEEPVEEPAPVLEEPAPEYVEIDGVRYVKA